MGSRLTFEYLKTFHDNPSKLYMAPCRINLIGEHTDYNLGLALPAAISKYIAAVVGKRNDRKIHLKSLSKRYDVEVDLDNISNTPENGWGNYPLGIFATLIKRGHKLPFGLNIVYQSNVPIASGLSSSAAVLNLTGLIATDMYGLNYKPEEIALLAHQSETEFNGLQCGVMDEFAIALGKKDKCILLDCKDNSFEYKNVDFKDYSLAVIVSNVKRNLVVSPYNTRVEECKKAVDLLKPHFSIDSLSELKPSDLDKCKEIIKDDVIYRRVRHIVSENQRVRDFVEASNKGDVAKMAQILNESHESLRDDYEVTGEYLDYIHEISLKYGALGERMTGAGFGGSSIALIKKDNFEDFKEKVIRDYEHKFGFDPLIFLADICDGLIVKSL